MTISGNPDLSVNKPDRDRFDETGIELKRQSAISPH